MSDKTPLARTVSVAPRFCRSIALARDWHRQEAIDGYLLTPAGREMLHRLADSLRARSPVRAWTLTGPYGSGKSAFALFTATLLCGNSTTGSQARALLKREDPTLWRHFFPGRAPARETLCPILIAGTREPLEQALAAALETSLRSLLGDRLPKELVRAFDAVKTRASTDQRTAAVTSLFETALDVVSSRNKAEGFLLVIDELGKFLEYAAYHPEQGDIFVLQALAELAARSERPFFLLTILHQAMDRYTEQVSPGRRQEWAKVQGRFQDVAFDEPTEQVLRLLARAIEQKGIHARQFAAHGQSLAKYARQLALTPPRISDGEATSLLAACSPLHPTTALLLGPLFRRLAQNERSLFAFLTSGEAFGFGQFLNESFYPDLYRLDRLYDYAVTTLGSSLYALHRGKVWAEIQDVLERLHDASSLELRVAKVVGIIQALGYAAGFPASKELLQFALGGDGVHEKDVNRAIAALEKRSLIVYRRHAGGYALWEGSDLDIDQLLGEARPSIDPSRSLQAYLKELAPPRPLVARSHSYHTGTLRYFHVLYADRDHLAEVYAQQMGSADGRVIYCLPLNAEDRKAFQTLLTDHAYVKDPRTILALPTELLDLEDTCRELAALRSVRDNTPELANDAAARKELRARLAAMENLLVSQLRRVFRPGSADGPTCRWFRLGKETTLATPRSFNELLSQICDEVYWATPRWTNELINRRSLSSAAAAARRNLIEAMIEHQLEEALGIQGTPPERSMYGSILAASGLHRKGDNGWAFGPPRKTDKPLTAVWKAVENFFNEAEGRQRPVAGLFTVLRAAPFGLKDGVLPVLLAAALLYGNTEVALYEEGTFVPSLTTAVFERVLRSPEQFEVQRCRIAGPRAIVFTKYAAMLSGVQEADSDKPTLLTVVRPLLRFVQKLPEYVSNTQQLNPIAKAVLGVLQQARQPDRLLFTDLPGACGSRPFGLRGKPKTEQMETYFGTLRSALSELQQAYPKLQAEIARLLADAFGLNGPAPEHRLELTHRAKLVSDLTVEAKLKSFLQRLTDATSDDAIWLESLAALLGGKPSRAWNDQDRARFEVNLALTARTFRHFESLAFEMERQGAPILDGDDHALRVAVTLPRSPEVERVVRIPAHIAPRAEQVQCEIRRLLDSADFLRDHELSAAVLAQIVRQLLVEEVRDG